MHPLYSIMTRHYEMFRYNTNSQYKQRVEDQKIMINEILDVRLIGLSMCHCIHVHRNTSIRVISTGYVSSTCQ